MPKPRRVSKKTQKPWVLLAWFIAVLLLLSLALAWISSHFANFSGWPSFLVILIITCVLVWLTWHILRREPLPRWVLWLTIAAAILRLSLGVVWFLALPAGGYETEVQQAGYVMEDAFNRDRAAWELARTGQPLTLAFQGYSSTDQYGGLLFLSAAVYRYLGGGEHTPLLVLTLAATISGMAVAFTWAFARRIFSEKVAFLAAWSLALYPEAVLLGSSQMREAFTVFLVPLSLYGLVRFREEKTTATLALFAAPILLSIPLTWAFTPSMVLLLVLVYSTLDDWRWLRSTKVWRGLLILGVALAIVFVLYVDKQGLWLMQSARWQAYVSANASGWVAREFERMPLFAQIPFLVIYGMFRPLLPAALLAGGPPIWMAIGIWRALGWTVLLALLAYASYLAVRTEQWRQVPGALLLASWVVTITASYRGGGDLWDSPRYRSAFAGVQVMLAAWAWEQYRETKDPWLRRALGGAGVMIAWFLPWYLRRYADFDWPIVELYQVIGLGLVSAALFVMWDWLNQE
jgi:4-amino-4-deoxy-L-arabinose transferase-like glycosyltransferase